MTGTIKRVIFRGEADRFGIITDEEGYDRFFHARDSLAPGIAIGDLAVGETVEFTPYVGGRNGYRARDVRPAVS